MLRGNTFGKLFAIALTGLAAALAINFLHPAPPPFPAQAAGRTWNLQSVDAMKVTKDVICGPKDRAYIENWVNRAAELGATHIAISTPYDNPRCGDAVSYTKTWISVIRAKGLKVWHRQMPLAFEGIYDTPKNAGIDYQAMIRDYIINNKDNYQAGDIFTPIPEPQNGGIQGFSYCAQNVCMFNSISHFNQWLRSAIDTSNSAFNQIGLGGKVSVGYYGFDGFVAWGHNNPDWNGILEDATIAKMGNITIDHYPEAVGTSMEADLAELTSRYPGVPIIIGEWGTINGGDREAAVRNSMGAAARNSSVVGFNYWTMGPGGNEALVDDSFNLMIQYDEVQTFYKNGTTISSPTPTVAATRTAATTPTAAASPVASCPSGQYKAEYFNSLTQFDIPALTRCEAAPLSYDWGSAPNGSPAPSIPADGFWARWTGRFNFGAADYTFIARADDGVRLWVDGAILIDQWKDQGATEYRASKSLSAGDHEVKVEYYERGGGAVAQVRWEQTGIPNPSPTVAGTQTPATTQPTIAPGSRPPANPTATPTPTTAPPSGPVAVQNPSFDTLDGNGFALHWVRSGDGVWDGSVRHSGKGSIKVTGPSNNHIYQNLNLKPNTQYTLSYWVKTANVQGSGVQIKYLSGSTTVGQASYTKGTQDWTKVSTTFRTPASVSNGKVDIVWQLVPGDSIWVDDVSITQQ